MTCHHGPYFGRCLECENDRLRAALAAAEGERDEARAGKSPCVDDDGTPFASARTWRTAYGEAESWVSALTAGLSEWRKTAHELHVGMDHARDAQDKAESALAALEARCAGLEGALRDTRWWGREEQPSTWCWCEEDCGGTDFACESARTALSPSPAAEPPPTVAPGKDKP